MVSDKTSDLFQADSRGVELATAPDSDAPASPCPSISVIMIFFNASRFMRQAIDSVAAQTFRDWELILVDDGSTDGSTEIALDYAWRYPDRIRYVNHHGHVNRGTGASRNVGIEQARGEFVAFLDGDDVWMPAALERMIAAMRDHPDVGMIYGPTEYWYSWTGDPRDAAKDYLDFASGRGISANSIVLPPDLLTHFLRWPGSVPCMCSLLVRRTALLDVGGFEDSFDGLYEDQAMYAKVALRASVFVLGEPWAKYRRHPESSCAIAEQGGREPLARRFYLEWLAEYLKLQRVTDRELWNALNRALRASRHPLLVRFMNVTWWYGRESARRARQVMKAVTANGSNT